MIESLYEPFRQWSAKGSVYLISDTHLEDSDMEMLYHWPDAADYMSVLAKTVHKNDCLIHLGDVGNPEYFSTIKAHKVLILGNHDKGAQYYAPYFDEIYTGPLIIAEKILLSHEPIEGLPCLMNIHGHTHDKKGGYWLDRRKGSHYNICSNCVYYSIINLGHLIKDGLVSNIDSIHRLTIDRATERKHGRNDTVKNANV